MTGRLHGDHRRRRRRRFHGRHKGGQLFGCCGVGVLSSLALVWSVAVVLVEPPAALSSLFAHAQSSSSPPAWTQVGGPFEHADQPHSKYGTSIGLTGSVFVSGAPRAGEFAGAALIYARLGGRRVFLFALEGGETSGRFGTSVHVATNVGNGTAGVLVGAPGVFAAGTTTPIGAAYYYEVDYGSVPDFYQIGGPLQGAGDVFAANERFGESVSSSAGSGRRRRIVVGAPGYNAGLQSQVGRIYPYDLVDETTWTPMQKDAIVGATASDHFGSSVSISRDGSRILAGGPGDGTKQGYAAMYTWDGTRWTLSFLENGVQNTEAFGSSVRMLSRDGSIFAVGGRRFGGNLGVIRVYKAAVDGGSATQIGQDIVGNPGDRLGKSNTLSGNPSRIYAGTASGSVRVFDLDPNTREWVEFDSIVSGYSKIRSLSGSGSTVAVAGNDEALIFTEAPV